MVKLTRRRVLAAGLGVAAASTVAAGAVGGLALSWWDRPPGEGLGALSTDEHAFADAVAEAWFPPGGTPAISGSEARMADFLDEVVAHMEPSTAKPFKLLLQALDAAPLPSRRSHFTALPLEERTEVLKEWVDSSSYLMRQGSVGVLVLLGIGWTTHPVVAAQMSDWFPCGYGR